jgi:soluble lytic murein transglycosylase-like protein
MKLPRLILAAVVMALSGTVCGAARAQNESWEDVSNPHELLSFEQTKVPRWIAETVVRAAQLTGVDPAFVMALADKESSFQPQSKARTSSAEGLFQFLEGTWLEVLSAHAAKHGFGAAADAITKVDGRYSVREPDQKRWILSLRQDPFLSALMACEMVKQSRAKLAQQTQRAPTSSELYLAHLLGANGAARLLKLVAVNPEERAPKAFPRAAEANKTLFFASKAKKEEATVAQVATRISAMIKARLDRYSTVSGRELSGTSVLRKVQVSSAAPL